MIQRRRFAHGSSTGEHQLQRAAIKTVDAHLQVQAAAQRVSADLDELLPVAVPDALKPDDSMVIVLNRAKRAIKA